MQVELLTAHVSLAVRPASHATTDHDVARGLDLAALSRCAINTIACDPFGLRHPCLACHGGCRVFTQRSDHLELGDGRLSPHLGSRLVELVIEARRAHPSDVDRQADIGGLADNTASANSARGQPYIASADQRIALATRGVLMRLSNVKAPADA